MKFETLKKSYKKEIVIGVSLLVILAIVLVVRLTFAKYNLVKSIKIAEGTINYKVPDFKMMAMYKNDGNGDIAIDTMPTGEYIINETKSYCTLDNVNKDTKAKLYTNAEGNHIISGLSKGGKCYLYFEKGRIAETALGRLKINVDKPNFAKTAQKSCEGIKEEHCEETNGIYATTDNDGETYYYRGAVENNYLRFAGFYWRVIRINGDGTIRLIYQGKTADASGEDAQIGESQFNPYVTNSMYIGFKYTDGLVHGYNEKSIILKDSLEPWYENNLLSYANKIDTNAGFCQDRTPSTIKDEINNQGGTGNTITYYRGYRIFWYGELPTLICPNSDDLFTNTQSNKGNKSLTYPIGLINMDEVHYAGLGRVIVNLSYYLYTGVPYWTITPYAHDYDGANNAPAHMLIYSNGTNYAHLSVNKRGVRPVINLKNDIKVTGTGTISDPYIVS